MIYVVETRADSSTTKLLLRTWKIKLIKLVEYQMKIRGNKISIYLRFRVDVVVERKKKSMIEMFCRIVILILIWLKDGKPE